MIEVKNLHKYYNKGRKNEQHVINDVSLELGNTGLVCILGESGSGKTTLLNTIGGLDTFSDGSIIIEEIELNKYDPKKIEPIRSERFDFIFQNYYLLKDYPVGYNVKLALNRFRISEEEKDERVDYVLNMLGMGKYKKKLVSTLSGGQQQRVSIARALVKSPDIILADEPTGNLDEENTLRTMSILKSISKECLVLLVTHEKRIAKFFGDRIIEVCDGKVVRDEENTAASAYERSDDSNIYLKEMECKNLENDLAAFRMYYGKEQPARKISLNLAWKDDKLYIQNNMDCDILLEGMENGVNMLDEERPKFDMDEMEKVSYNLPKLPSKGEANLGAREIWRMAVENIRLMGKKQAFVIVILLVTAVLLSLSMAEFINTVSMDERSIVSTDSHYVKMDFDKVTSFRTLNFTQAVYEYVMENLDGSDSGELFYAPKANLYLVGFGYAQMKNLSQHINGYSFVPVEKLKKESLTYGRMPEKRHEIVIDQTIIDKLKKSKKVTAGLYKSEEDYLDVDLRISGFDEKMTIVGISDTDEPAIFCGQNILLGLDVSSESIMSVSELKAEFPEEYKDLELADDEILVKEGLQKHYPELATGEKTDWGSGVGHTNTYEIVGSFPDSVGVNYVMSDAGCRFIRNLAIFEKATCMFYATDKKAATTSLKSAAKKYMGLFSLDMTVPHDDEIKEYREEHSTNVDAKKLITLVIVVISLIMVYFMIKSNAMARSEELTVYRLIGISKNSIFKAYMLEMVLMTCYTSLPAVLITSGVIKFIGSIPSLEIGMIFPWWSVLLLLAGIFIVHILISILPIYGILSKPPATLAVKE